MPWCEGRHIGVDDAVEENMAIAAQHCSGDNSSQGHIGTQLQSAPETACQQPVPAANQQPQQRPAQQHRDNCHHRCPQVAVKKPVNRPGTLHQIEAGLGIDNNLRETKGENAEVFGRKGLACNCRPEVERRYRHGDLATVVNLRWLISGHTAGKALNKENERTLSPRLRSSG